MLAGLEVQKFGFPANISRREIMLAVGSGVGDPRRSLGFQVGSVRELWTNLSVGQQAEASVDRKVVPVRGWTSAELVSLGRPRRVNRPASNLLKSMKQYTSLSFFHVTKRKHV